MTRGTANVFADLGFPHAIERQVRLRLAFALNQLLAGRQLSPIEAAKVLGVTRVEGAALRHYKLANLSLRRLMNLLTALDRGCRNRDSPKAEFPEGRPDYGRHRLERDREIQRCL